MVLTDKEVLTAGIVATLSEALTQAVLRAQALGEEIVACVSLPPFADCDLQALVTSGVAGARRGYWLSPRGEERCALGAIQEIVGDGEDAVADVAAQWETVVAKASVGVGCSLLGYGGFAFAPEGPRDAVWQDWPGGALVLPRIHVHKRAGVSLRTPTITVSVQQRVQPDSDPVLLARDLAQLYTLCQEAGQREPVAAKASTDTACDARPVDDARYQMAVAETASDIRAGRYRKVVLARRVDYACDARARVAKALGTLRDTFSDSTLFLFGRDDAVFLGASPERLISVQAGTVAIDCLAGTTVRSPDRAQDEQLMQELLDSKKNRAEHQAVVDFVLAAAASFAQDVTSAPTPCILKLVHVQHLHTPVTGRLREGQTVLSAVQALHPTPAVAGFPRQDARTVIRDREPLDRGYYAGPFGFIDSAGNGEFVVALRCALVRPEALSLFAGGGIMGDSEAAVEWAETEWKMRPMRTAFGLEQMPAEKRP